MNLPLSRTSAMKFALAASCALLAPTCLAAPCQDEDALGGQEQCRTGYAVYLDNDVLLFDQGDDEDRNYTMGLSFQSSGRWIETRGLARPLYWTGSLPLLR